MYFQVHTQSSVLTGIEKFQKLFLRYTQIIVFKK